MEHASANPAVFVEKDLLETATEFVSLKNFAVSNLLPFFYLILMLRAEPVFLIQLNIVIIKLKLYEIITIK